MFSRRFELCRPRSLILHGCRAWDADGIGAKEAAKRMKRHPFYVQKLYAQARNFGEEELREATLRLAELDHALKGGSRLSSELELERALVDVTRPAESAPQAGARA